MGFPIKFDTIESGRCLVYIYIYIYIYIYADPDEISSGSSLFAKVPTLIENMLGTQLVKQTNLLILSRRSKIK